MIKLKLKLFFSFFVVVGGGVSSFLALVGHPFFICHRHLCSISLPF